MTKPQATEDGWAPVDYHEFPANIIDWDVTPSIEGELIWRETVPTTGLDGSPRDSTMYAIATTGGEQVGVWGTAMLDAQLAKVPDGAAVKITHQGKESIGGARQMRRFEVLTRPGA